MTKLLSANFRRLWRSRVLWVLIAGIILYSVYAIFAAYSYAEAKRSWDEIPMVEGVYFAFVPFTGILYGVLIRLFLGSDHHEGTLRNKLIVGHSRRDIFLSNYVVAFVGCSILLATFFLFGLLEMIAVGPFTMGAKDLTLYILIAIGMASVFAALFTWITAVSTNPALTALYVGIIWGVMLGLASGLYDVLDAPKMMGGMAFIDGQFVEMPMEPNPNYISGWTRTLLECIMDALPTGQGILMTELAIEHPIRELVSSVVLTGGFLGLGIFHFNRKDIK